MTSELMFPVRVPHFLTRIRIRIPQILLDPFLVKRMRIRNQIQTNTYRSFQYYLSLFTEMHLFLG